DFAVSIETGFPARLSSTGTTRRSSSSRGTPSEPGRVDSPPTSTIAAPSSSIPSAAVAAADGEKWTPPSENDAVVTSRTPITDGRANRSVRLLAGAFRFGRLHGRAGKRERPRLAGRAGLWLRLGLRLGLRRGLEHVVLVLAGKQPHELVLVDRLALDQDLRDPVEVVDVLAQHLY